MSEHNDHGIDVRAIGWAALAIAGAIVFALAGSWYLWRALGPGANTARPSAAIPAPRLQPAPQQELAAYFAEKELRLATWGWVDRGAGVGRMPLDEAMRLMAARAEAAGKGKKP